MMPRATSTRVDPAPLAAGEGADPRVGVVGEPDQLQDLRHRARVGVELGEDGQQLTDRQLVVEAGRLQHQPDAGAPGPAAAAGIGAEHPDAASRGAW